MQDGHEKEEKEIRWIGSSYDDLLVFPHEARKKAGFQLGKVQAGLDPEDWKPFDAAGAGTKEIRIKDSQGIYRVMFVAKFEEAVYVLHCFQKKRRRQRNMTKTSQRRVTALSCEKERSKNDDRY